MLRKKWCIIILSIVCTSIFVSCAAKDRKVIEAKDKKVTVMNDSNKNDYKEIGLKKIDKYENIRGMDWLDENKLLISKENSNIGQVKLGTQNAYPQNLYSYDLQSKEAKLILEGKYHAVIGMLSPDKKSLFHISMTEGGYKGFIGDIEGKNTIKVTGEEGVKVSDGGQWISNDQVLYPSGRKVCVSNTKGEVTVLEELKDKTIINPIKIGDSLYYIDNLKLMMMNLKTKENKVIKDNVERMIPSPNSTEFAVVKVISGSHKALVLTDIDGKEKSKLVEGVQIYGLAWSPDQKKLAYAVAADNPDHWSIFISDMEKNKAIPILSDMLITTPLKWSPSGKQILVSTMENKDNKNILVTHIIKLE